MHETCTIKQLPDDQLLAAAKVAVEINPANAPPVEAVQTVLFALMPALAGAQDTEVFTPQHLAVMTSKYWGVGGVDLTVGFMEPTPVDLRERILAHANAWSERANVRFRWVGSDPQVRITREGDGYWSFLGTDILTIARGRPTMCLQGFTMATPQAEYDRVVEHEFGHTIGFPHEHMRRGIIARLDVQKTIAWGARSLGWNEQMVRQQILTPIEETALIGTAAAEETSIMCYRLPAEITKDGRPIIGGNDITASDHAHAAKVYPKAITPPDPPKPDGGSMFAKILALIAALRAGDLAAVLRILAELFAARQAGQLTDADFAEAERAMTVAQQQCAPK